jgi:16S rRNA (guanine527-N7)-methyltransferase
VTQVESIHMALLEKWRGAMNLVGPGPLRPHFVDSRGAVAGLDATGRWADLGSGAGFPGIALAEACPSAQVLLVESRLKRAQFLKRLVIETGLGNVEVFHGRSESLEPGLDGLISRAYRVPEAVLKDAQRLLLPAGRAVLLSGSGLAEMAGWQVLHADRYPVVDGDRVRTVMARCGAG